MKQLYLHRNKHREAVSVKRQRNMSQMKEQNQTPEKELNEMKTSNLPDAVFKTLVIRMLNELRGRTDGLRDKEIGSIKMEVENIKNNHSEMKI